MGTLFQLIHQPHQPDLSSCFSAIWNGWTDEIEEGVYRNVDTGEKMPQDLWKTFAHGKPDGGTTENCLVTQFGYNTTSMEDFSCNDAWFVAVCSLDKAPQPKMRGQITFKFLKGFHNGKFSFLIGFDKNFDIYYTVDPLQLQAWQLIIYGFYDTKLMKDEHMQKWKLSKVTDPAIYAIVNATGSPMGTHLYEKSDEAGGGSFTANLYACNDDEEFVCQDGTCVSIEQRYYAVTFPYLAIFICRVCIFVYKFCEILFTN